MIEFYGIIFLLIASAAYLFHAIHNYFYGQSKYTRYMKYLSIAFLILASIAFVLNITALVFILW